MDKELPPRRILLDKGLCFVCEKPVTFQNAHYCQECSTALQQAYAQLQMTERGELKDLKNVIELEEKPQKNTVCFNCGKGLEENWIVCPICETKTVFSRTKGIEDNEKYYEWLKKFGKPKVCWNCGKSIEKQELYINTNTNEYTLWCFHCWAEQYLTFKEIKQKRKSNNLRYFKRLTVEYR